jgi:hypothetical protein
MDQHVVSLQTRKREDQMQHFKLSVAKQGMSEREPTTRDR